MPLQREHGGGIQVEVAWVKLLKNLVGSFYRENSMTEAALETWWKIRGT
jgi:hypothetical protein